MIDDSSTVQVMNGRATLLLLFAATAGCAGTEQPCEDSLSSGAYRVCSFVDLAQQFGVRSFAVCPQTRIMIDKTGCSDEPVCR